MTRVPKRYRPIIEQINYGATLAALFESHNKGKGQQGKLNVGLAAISTLQPSEYQRLMGQPASTLTFLADACFRHRAIASVHKQLGRAHALRFVEGVNQNAPDYEVLDTAIERGYSGLITYDAARKSLDDMCVYADSLYARNLRIESPVNLTSVIVISQGHEEEVFRKNKTRILEHIETIPESVLDLR